MRVSWRWLESGRQSRVASLKWTCELRAISERDDPWKGTGYYRLPDELLPVARGLALARINEMVLAPSLAGRPLRPEYRAWLSRAFGCGLAGQTFAPRVEHTMLGGGREGQTGISSWAYQSLGKDLARGVAGFTRDQPSAWTDAHSECPAGARVEGRVGRSQGDRWELRVHLELFGGPDPHPVDLVLLQEKVSRDIDTEALHAALEAAWTE